MATGPVDVLEPLEVEETGKKKSRFQSFKNFFAKKKKKKEPSSPGAENTLKPSQSSSDLSDPHFDSGMLHLPADPGSKGNMGNKALSHDSIFIFELPPDTIGKTSSQENLPGKVKALQLKFQQTLQLRSPPLVIASKRTEDTGAISEDDGLPRSPPDISTLHDVLTSSASTSSNHVQRHSSLSLGGTDSEDDQVPSEASSRPVSPLSSSVLVSPISPTCRLLAVDFNSPAIPLGCLDTSAARHKIALNPRKQKAFNSKTQALAVGKLEKEQRLLRAAEGKTGHPKLLEETDCPEENSEGSSVQNTSYLKEIWINSAVPKTRSSNPLRYSWNFLPGPGGICISAPEDCNVTETNFQDDIAVSCTNAESSPAEIDLQLEEEGAEMTQYCINGLKPNLQSAGKEELEISEPSQTETEAVVLCDILFSSSHGNGMEKDFDSPAEFIHVYVDQKAKGSGNSSSAIQFDRVQERPGGGHGGIALGSDSQVSIPQFSLSASEMPSGAGDSAVPELEKSSVIKDNVECHPSEDPVEPRVSPHKESTILDTNLDSTEGKKLCLLTEFYHSVLNNVPGSQEAELLKKAHDSTVKNKLPSESAEVASESIPLNEDAREDQSDSIKLKEESRSPDEIVQIQLKSSSTNPVRFTIAPAWQRSLSGGSNSLDSSCPRSSPSSPVKPEFFEAVLDTATLGSIPNNLERLNGDIGKTAANDWPKEEPQSHDSPFGVKLRRTASLLKYQTGQQHHEPPKLDPLAFSSVSSVKDEPKSPEPGQPPQKLTSNAKSLGTKVSFQEEKSANKAKPEEVTAKQQMNRLPEKNPPAHLEIPSSEPAWISMAKLKQKGFQGLPLAKGPKEEEKALAQAEPEEEKNPNNSKPEKDALCENLLKKSSTPPVNACENKAQVKITSSSPTASIKMVPQETTCAEKDIKTSLSLPVSTCSPAEPPWLSLAKKKAKAWSEMPQMVQ
ncbi:acrosomal protein KIAA1210 homolog isoform X2 [Sphaerodactylus townsendi]|nr:acrosomal protein KIAA1210 homolog isoform X2 [Sphaerodactylus townsendi]